ncbi:MAG: hypothetical protein P4L26_14125 [Terracidiphilus sp.]|nr:hypothetical protein [Terracidiphilus sp.]
MARQSAPAAANQTLENEWWTPRLAGPVLLAAVIRFGMLALALVRTGTTAVGGTDTVSYLSPGRNLLLHGTFSADGVPAVMRTPGYPLFLAMTSLAGLTVAAVINVLLSLFCLVLVWRLAKAVSGDDRLAICAAWLMAIEPLTIIFSILLLSETLFMAFFLFGAERLAWFFRVHRLRLLAVSGVSLAAAALVRPAAYYLPVAMAFGLLIVLVRVPGLRWKAPAVLLISCLPWLAIWQIRNKVETGYGGFSSARELNLYFTNAVGITARLEHRNYFDVHNEFGYSPFFGRSGQVYLAQEWVDHHPEQAGWTQAQRIAFMGEEGSRVIRAHPRMYARTCIEPLVSMMLEPGAGYFARMLSLQDSELSNGVGTNQGMVHFGINLIKTHPAIAASKAVFMVVLAALYLLALKGILRGSIGSPYLALLVGTAFYFIGLCAVTAGPGYDPRFRIPLLPIVCIFAAAGLLRKKPTAA